MIRLGAVSYLNTKPLIETLPERLLACSEYLGPTLLSVDLPSRLAADLRDGRLDVALIPSIEYFRGANYEIVSGSVIACRGPVWSVRLLSRVPVRQIRTLALDEGSRTSAALVQILLAEMHGLRPVTVPFPMDAVADSIDADALLMIGDRAMHPPRGVYREIWDLGDRWNRWTELPFVFAMWVARHEVAEDKTLMEHLSRALDLARDDGVSRLEEIAKREAASQGLTNEDCYRYFAENLHFTMGPRERAGLAAFRKRAVQLGLAPPFDSNPPVQPAHPPVLSPGVAS